MRVAAYQAPLAPVGSREIIGHIEQRVRWCESEGIAILCCPEGIIGGLADYCDQPAQCAIRVADGELENVLAPLRSGSVTLIIGFTELGSNNELYNAAAVLHQGRLAGIYRKLHPAIRQSVYSAGAATCVFRAGGVVFGVVICNDSNYPEPARRIAQQGASILFIPTNNGLPMARAEAEIVRQTREVDKARAIENKLWVVRADVAGKFGELMSFGSSGIVDPSGNVVQEGRAGSEDLLVVGVSSEPGSPTP